MKRIKPILRDLGSLKATCFLLVAFLLLIFFGVMGQASAGNTAAGDRFFNSYFIWAMGVVPVPAMKSLAVIGTIHLVLSIIYRIPRGLKNGGLYLIHVAILVLLVGSLVGSELRQEYEGYGIQDDFASFVATNEDFAVQLGDSLSRDFSGYGKGEKFTLGGYDFAVEESCENGYVSRDVPEGRLEVKNATGFSFFECVKGGEGSFPGMILRVSKGGVGKERILLGLDEPLPWILSGGETLRFVHRELHFPFRVKILTADGESAEVELFETGKDSEGYRVRLGQEPLQYMGYGISLKGLVPMSQSVSLVLMNVSDDPLHGVPYVFMVLLLVGGIWQMFARIRFRLKGPMVTAVLFAGILGMAPSAHAFTDPCLEPWTPVKVGESVRPFDSFARGILDNFSGKVKYKSEAGKISATEVVADMMKPEKKAEDYALFKVLRADVQRALNLPESERYVSYRQLVQSRGLLEIYAGREDDHPATAEMKRLFDNVQMFEVIAAGEAFQWVDQTDADVSRLKMEWTYNKANFALIAFIFAFIGCALAAVNSLFKKRALDVIANIFCGITTVVLSVAFLLRFYIASRPPLSSLYEIVLLVALLLEAFEFGAFVFCKKRTFGLIIPVTLMATVLLFFAKFVLEPGDTFAPIPAVLNSSVFLTVHVFTIALGYVGMILSGVVAHIALVRSHSQLLEHQPIKKLLYGSLLFGFAFTTIGTLLGGVWADVAWGRFWGFDPKECGALFVVLWASLLIHLKLGRLVSETTFALLNCFNVLVTFLCWFGINLLGVGLHSYGFQNGTLIWLVAFTVVDLLLVGFLYPKKQK